MTSLFEYDFWNGDSVEPSGLMQAIRWEVLRDDRRRWNLESRRSCQILMCEVRYCDWFNRAPCRALHTFEQRVIERRQSCSCDGTAH